MLRVVDVDAAADGCGDGREIAFVGADDEVVAAQGTFDDAGVDDVGGAGAAGEGSRGPGPGVVESFGFRIRLGTGRAAPGGGCRASTGLSRGRGLSVRRGGAAGRGGGPTSAAHCVRQRSAPRNRR